MPPRPARNKRVVRHDHQRPLDTGRTPGEIVDLPDVWSADETWKRLIFTPEQPFLSDEAETRRQAGLDAARVAKRKAEATLPD